MYYDGDAPLLTCAPTGAGKGRSVLIPTLLTYTGPIICIDVLGQNYQVTQRRRREMGHQVVCLDPFHLVTNQSDRLNPLDLLTLPRSDVETDAEMLASMLAVGNQNLTDPFWNITATGLTAAMIAQVASYPELDRHFGKVGDWFHHHDMDYAIAEMLDKNEIKSRMAREQFIAYLAAPTEQTRPCIRTMALSYISVLASTLVQSTLKSSTFRLLDVLEGKPITIYIVLPPDKLESHRALIRLNVGTLLTAVMRRSVMPQQKTLFLLDECAQLGSFSLLRQSISLLRNAGLQTWTIWQDLSQLRHLYPNDWQTIVNNSGVLQVFGITNNGMAKEWSDLLGLSSRDLNKLGRDNAFVHRQGQGSITCRRADYLKDAVFSGLFDANPRFALRGPADRSTCQPS